ncbi:MAG TPA: glycosyltransferase [Kiritimatiellia bacterium]|jgi:glycosyltransferase involved in cell wall biosynthesis
MPPPAHTLSVITVAFNEAPHIPRLLESIRRMSNPAHIRIESVLVDGGSTDGTPAAARAAGFDKVVDAPGANIPACRNRGLREAAGGWIAFVDGDCELAADWLERAAPLLDGQDSILAGWPAVPPEPMTWVQAAWRFHWVQKNPRYEEYRGRRVVLQEGFRLATTRNMVLQRRVAEQVGGFNEELSTGEDTDFAYRAYLAGVKVIGDPSLVVTHHGEPATLGAFYRQQVWHANRKSYRHILAATGGKVGGNAPRFAAAFLASLVSAAIGAAGCAVTRNAWWLAAVAPLAAVVGGPALLISARGRTLRWLPALAVLYGAYGLARAWDLLGLAQSKPSWKSGASAR